MPHAIISKPYKLTFEERVGYLYAYVQGEHDSYAVSRAYWQEIADVIAAKGLSKVLIEEDIVENASMADAYQLMCELPEMGFSTVRIAFVDRYVEQSDLNEFSELVAIDRGLDGKIFNDVSEAEKWLMVD